VTCMTCHGWSFQCSSRRGSKNFVSAAAVSSPPPPTEEIPRGLVPLLLDRLGNAFDDSPTFREPATLSLARPCSLPGALALQFGCP